MEFEEKFPSLQEEFDSWTGQEDSGFYPDIIQKHCLDKQKVKKAIDNFEHSKWDEMDSFDVWFKRELKKELGL